jgi:hypothetical protein
MGQRNDDDEGHAIDDEAVASRAGTDDLGNAMRQMLGSTDRILKEHEAAEERRHAQWLIRGKIVHAQELEKIHVIARYVFMALVWASMLTIAFRWW